jgi:hypothetical protein
MKIRKLRTIFLITLGIMVEFRLSLQKVTEVNKILIGLVFTMKRPSLVAHRRLRSYLSMTARLILSLLISEHLVSIKKLFRY